MGMRPAEASVYDNSFRHTRWDTLYAQMAHWLFVWHGQLLKLALRDARLHPLLLFKH